MTHDMGWVAIGCGVGSAIGYTLANICLRSVTHLDPTWVSQVKTVPTVVGMAPWILVRLVRGQALVPSLGMLGLVMATGAVGQLFGNVAFQWSLGVIGVALSVPLTLGAMIVSGGLLGRILLGDRISHSMTMASAVLMLAICVLSFGAPQANASILQTGTADEGHSLLLVLAAVAAACLSGVAYSCLSVMLRFAANRGTPISSLLFVVGLTGFVLLGGIVRWRLGRIPWETLHGENLAYLLGAGTTNVLAFAALTKALHLASVPFVNALSASQSAMAALVGVLLFGEALSLPMLAGVALTAAGLMMIRGDAKLPDLQAAGDQESGR
jgi:drug/metabolite transporter (DMT)-like permease